MTLHRVALALALATVALAAPARAGTRDPDDEVEMTQMRAHKPRAAELVEKGEASLAEGALWDADGAFRQAQAEDPSVALPWRRDCEALVLLGRRGDAANACVRALELRHANVNLRGLVHALVDGPRPPSPNDLFQALTITSSVRESGPSFTTAAMACAIAEATGDAPMLRRCADDLQRFAPEDPATRHAHALLASRCPPARFWLGWGVLAAALLASIGHAWRRSRFLRGATAAAVIVLVAFPRIARAASDDAPRIKPLTTWPIDDAHPEQSIPNEKARNADPLQFGYWLQDVALKGSVAHDHGDHVAAARFYAALALAVPDRAIGYVKQCDEYDEAGDTARAIEACGQALMRDGTTAKDYVHFVDLLVGKPGSLTQTEVAALDSVVEHMKTDPGAASVVDEVECKVGTRTSNVAQLRECTAALAARDPAGIKTITYQWALAIQEGRVHDAEGLLERAKGAGIPVEEMTRTTEATRSRQKRQLALVLLGALIVVGAVVAGGRALRGRHIARVAA